MKVYIAVAHSEFHIRDLQVFKSEGARKDFLNKKRKEHSGQSIYDVFDRDLLKTEEFKNVKTK